MEHKIVFTPDYEIDESIVKTEAMEPEQNLDSGNLEMNVLEVMNEYNSNTMAMPKLRNRRNRSQSSTASKHNYSTDKLTLRKDRFRPIRPKPLQSFSISKHKLGMPSMNMSTFLSNRIIIPNTMPNKEKIQYTTSSNISNEINNCIKPQTNSDNKNSNKINSKNINNSNNNITSILSITEENKTVLNLPKEVQADIKMQICKIVATAEIKYCGSKTKSKTEN
ncbi:putative uncharacterized protein DDB_G0286829 [Pogonomyrmex barbatus]|uniref:Uncharacterized protein n=1 Tax=Pogonomyrmex barbatus TaxID=144034 RepID=A0A6I9WY90_9HYME|nr:putative uncharacterized protein DDB_G0286829 [Pogonomyrmex barbatus]